MAGLKVHPDDLASLSHAERAKSACFRDPSRAARFCAARALLRLALARRMNCSAEKLILEETPNGKPYARDALHLNFSVSYDRSCVFIAICVGREVGLDVQYLTAKRFETVRQFILNASGDSKAADDPARIWTRMEAYGKMVGTGLALGMRYLLDIALGRAPAPTQHQFLECRINGAALTASVGGTASAHIVWEKS